MGLIEKKDFKKEYIEKGDYHFRLKEFDSWFICWNYKLLIHPLADDRKGLILDLACGDGLLESLYPSLRFVGIDFSEQAIEFARSRNRSSHCEFVCADMTKLPFPADRFDAVVSSLSLQYLDRRALLVCLEEVHRVMKRGRLFAFSYINSRYRLIDQHAEKLKKENREVLPVLETQEIVDCLKQAGFRLERILGTNYPINYRQVPTWCRKLVFHLSKIGYFFYRSSYHHVYVARNVK